MIYVLAFFLPFVALALKGMYVQAVLNFVFWVVAVVCFVTVFLFWLGILSWLISVVWAWIAIAQRVNKQRHQEVLEALGKNAGEVKS